MTWPVLSKLLAMFIVVALGWWAAHRRWLGEGDAARLFGNAAFTVFIPALLFRTAARLDLAALPWRTLAAFFVPALLLMLAVYAWARRRGHAEAPARATVRATTACYGNAVQVGIPVTAALFGETGLGLYLALVSLHGLLLLSVLTALAEHDLARAHADGARGVAWLALLRSMVLHPVVLPLVAGLLLNATGWLLPDPIDQALQVLGTAVVPVCLLLIGLSLQSYGLRGPLAVAFGLATVKLALMPLLVLAVAHWGFGLTGLPLSVVVMMAALPVGSNALLFAQRYRCDEAQATAAIVASTLAFALTAPLWLAALAAFQP